MAGLNTDAEAARAILTDIDNRSFKAALNKVDKKLKKTDSDYFKVRACLPELSLYFNRSFKIDMRYRGWVQYQTRSIT